jgi:2,3-dihydro-2,3-dihydroxybenzoate dehydrogenase
MGTGSTVVVGAAQGIGEAVAKQLASESWGGQLWEAEHHPDAAANVATELRAGGTDCDALKVDIADPASVEQLVAATEDAAQVAIVAGIFGSSPALETPKSEFDRILAVNLVGVFLVAQAYARRMVLRGDGSICGVASIAARMPRMKQVAYCASKAGMRQALRVLALETVPRGVTINTVSPGPTDTPMMRRMARDHPNINDLAQGSPDAFRPRIPSGRVGTSEDVAAGVAFLLSPRSRHVAMQDLVIDGGELLGM